jgi:uncharacterized protein (TIGR02145 family)
MKKSNVYFAIAFVATFFLAPLLGGVGGGFFASLTGGAGVGYAQVGINTTGQSPDTSSMLDINADGSPKGGLLIPRMTTTDRGNIPTPKNSLLIFNTDNNCFESYSTVTSSWNIVACTGGCGGSTPGSPTANAAINMKSPGINPPNLGAEFTVSYSAVAGATAYYLDIALDNAFTIYVPGYNNLNIGNVTSYNVTGLRCATTYYYRVRANNTCGTSGNSNTITVTTNICLPACGYQQWLPNNMNSGIQVTQATTQSAGQKWCYGDIAANCTTYGGLYQWASAMNLPSSENSVLHYGVNLPNCDPCGAGGVQGICPAGYHIPTDLEWSRYEYCIENNIAPTGSTTLATFQTTGWRGSSAAGVGPGAKMKVTFGNSPAWDGTNTSGFSALPAGYSGGGTSDHMGEIAYLWAASEHNATDAWHRDLDTDDAESYRSYANKTVGFSVRCLQN